MPATLRALVVEDNPGDARLMQEALRDARTVRFDVTHAPSLATAIDCLDTGSYDIVLCDLSLPDSSGLETVNRLKATAPGLPLIVLTGSNDEETGLAAMQAGAQDFMVKGICDGDSLARGIRYAMERHRLQAALETARLAEIATKDDFLSHVSHELRSPLTTIYQFVTIILDGLSGPISEEQREYLEITLRSVNQLRRMIGDLLDVTRASNGKMRIQRETLNLADTVATAVRAMAESAKEAGIELTADVASAPTVSGDDARIRQVVTNLLDNAIKFTQRGGTITVTAGILPESDGAALVTVTDTGAGMETEDVERMFERLYQAPDATEASRRGLGLGLHICHEIVSLHGGRIWCESTPGNGASISFTVPASAATENEAASEGGSAMAQTAASGGDT
ncbi:MAG: hybrid sensor histidine kinase/response regulator [Armatimonadetes bacterium]|nr:hybrid sensor histidine kinase/response regulator [Armatimonadota bacterium]MDE2206341.1 hybrid sensor histidine kinase/response regulator [Armatimonadota bacterium]